MYSLVLFNLILIFGFAGNYSILSLALLANVMAFVEYRLRQAHEESQKVPATRRYSRGSL